MRAPTGRGIWLAGPSRYAGWPVARARAALAVLLLLVIALTVQPHRAPPPPGAPPAVENKGSESDLALYETIVDHVRHGEDYYQTTAVALRNGNYPLRPFFTFRLPGLARVQAMLPPAVILAFLWCLVAATAFAWMARLRGLLPRAAPRIVAALLIAGGMVAVAHPALVAFHEIWAALLIAWSLAAWNRRDATAAMALALMAMLIRETAAVYVLVMAGLAVMTGQRREALGWAVTLLAAGGAVAAHAVAVAEVTGPLDPGSPGWTGLNGAWFFAMSVRHATVLEMFPFPLAAPIIALALFGWTVPAHPLTLRMATVLAAYGVLIACFARLDNFYWGLMVAPVALVGLAFVPDGLRDLGRAALDRRRLTVTRTTA